MGDLGAAIVARPRQPHVAPRLGEVRVLALLRDPLHLGPGKGRLRDTSLDLGRGPLGFLGGFRWKPKGKPTFLGDRPKNRHIHLRAKTVVPKGQRSVSTKDALRMQRPAARVGPQYSNPCSKHALTCEAKRRTSVGCHFCWLPVRGTPAGSLALNGKPGSPSKDGLGGLPTWRRFATAAPRGTQDPAGLRFKGKPNPGVGPTDEWLAAFCGYPLGKVKDTTSEKNTPK